MLPLLSIPNPAKAQCSASDLKDVWWSPDKKSKIRVYEKDGKYYGKIIWLKEPNKEDGTPKVDEYNPDPEKRDRTIEGLVIFKDLECTEKNTLEDGTLYDPESGKSYSGWIALEDENTMKVRGFIGFSMLGRTEYFERVQ